MRGIAWAGEDKPVSVDEMNCWCGLATGRGRVSYTPESAWGGQELNFEQRLKKRERYIIHDT